MEDSFFAETGIELAILNAEIMKLAASKDPEVMKELQQS